MGWVTLSLRKLSLRSAINDLELQDLNLSRQTRSVQRHLSLEKSILNTDKKAEIKEAKQALLQMRKSRPENGVKDENYEEWAQEYSQVREQFEEDKTEIEDHYDELEQEIEEESTEEETRLQEEQTLIEAQLEAMRQELEAVNEQISSDIQSTKINLK